MNNRRGLPPEPDRAERGDMVRLPGLEALRPRGTVESDWDSDWITLSDAVDLLAPDISPASARSAIMQRVITGLVRVSCDQLTYQVDGRLIPFTRPGASARLAEQLARAGSQPLSLFSFNRETGDASWVDLSEDRPIHVLVQGLLVERGAVLAMIARRVGSAQPQRTSKRYSKDTPWSELVAWYSDRISSAPPEGYSRDEDEAAGKLLGIGREKVRELRKEHAPPSWQTGGRPGGL